MSEKKNVKAIRDLLALHPDGLSVPEMEKLTGIPNTSINAVCKRSPLIYIDRWRVHRYHNEYLCCWVAVYCLVPIPANAPKPNMKPSDYLRSMEAKVPA